MNMYGYSYINSLKTDMLELRKNTFLSAASRVKSEKRH